jgi:hypothetical protein
LSESTLFFDSKELMAAAGGLGQASGSGQPTNMVDRPLADLGLSARGA